MHRSTLPKYPRHPCNAWLRKLFDKIRTVRSKCRSMKFTQPRSLSRSFFILFCCCNAMIGAVASSAAPDRPSAATADRSPLLGWTQLAPTNSPPARSYLAMVTHNSVFAAHRLLCRMTNRKNRHPAFCLYRKIESGKRTRRACWFRRLAETNFKSATTDRFWLPAPYLFLDPRNVSGSKLPTAITLDQSVRELHDSIERFAVRRSFHPGFTDNNCRVIAVKPR